MKCGSERKLHVVFLIWCAWCIWAVSNLHRDLPVARTELDLYLPFLITPVMFGLAGWYGWRASSNVVKWGYPAFALAALLLGPATAVALEEGSHMFWRVLVADNGSWMWPVYLAVCFLIYTGGFVIARCQRRRVAVKRCIPREGSVDACRHSQYPQSGGYRGVPGEGDT